MDVFAYKQRERKFGCQVCNACLPNETELMNHMRACRMNKMLAILDEHLDKTFFPLDWGRMCSRRANLFADTTRDFQSQQFYLQHATDDDPSASLNKALSSKSEYKKMVERLYDSGQDYVAEVMIGHFFKE
jgi:hypothetical protein